VDGRIAYRNYLEGNAADELRPNVHANLLWRLDADHWIWALDGRWQQVRITQTGPASPANTQNQATLWTGPDFRASLSSVTTVIAEGRAGYQYNADTDDDNSSFGGALRISRKLRETVAVSGNLQARAVRYTDTSDDPNLLSLADFNIAEAYLGYSRQDARVESQLEVGGSFADLKGADNRSDLFLRIDTSRALGSRSKIGLTAFYGFDNEGNTVLVRSPVPDVDVPIEAAVPGLYYDKRGSAYYTGSTRRSTLSATIYARNRDFVDDLRDETTFGTAFSWSHRVTRRSDATVFGSFEHRDLDNVSLDYQDYLLGAEIRRRVNRKVSAAAELRHRRRNSSDASQEYNETALFLSLTYQIRP
jgi:hypothetical protein